MVPERKFKYIYNIFNHDFTLLTNLSYNVGQPLMLKQVFVKLSALPLYLERFGGNNMV